MTAPVTWLADVGAEKASLRAWNDLERWREMLHGMATIIPGVARPLVLEWLRDWRVYLLEQNTGRWPDGLFHLVDRDYLPWRGHEIAFTEFDIRRAFLDCECPWPRGWRPADKFMSVMDDNCFFKSRRRPYVLGVAEIMRGICHAALARIETLKARTTP